MFTIYFLLHIINIQTGGVFFCPIESKTSLINFSTPGPYSFKPKQTTISKSFRKDAANGLLVNRNRMPHSISSLVVPNKCFTFSIRFCTIPENAISLEATNTLFNFSYCVMNSRHLFVNLCSKTSVWTPFIEYASVKSNAFELISSPVFVFIELFQF